MRNRSWSPNILNWPSYINKKLGAGLVEIIKDRKEKGQLPEKFEKYASYDGNDFPTIRSTCMARPGWCIVEADYCTAEMRGLAYISEDRALKKLILEPDENFAKVKPECVPDGIEAEDCVVRLAFPKYVTLPSDKDKFLMTYSTDNKIKATFTEDQLLHDENGNIVHPSYDMHWGVSELARHTARETMNKKKDRGAAKVVNFCMAANTPIRTREGEVAIQNLTGKEEVWDGENWVHYNSVSRVPGKYIIEYMGLRATALHMVFVHSPTGKIWKVPFIIASKRGYKLVCDRIEPSYVEESPTQDKDIQEAIEALSELNADWELVYDLIDVGPNHRYTANGYIVGNSSSYGGTATSIARKIEADTGNKVTIDDAQALLDAVEARQPRATVFFHELEKAPLEKPFLVAASGRKRHLLTLQQLDNKSGGKAREDSIVALGRECRNYPMQESVGSSASIACKRLLDFSMRFSKSHGLQGNLITCLYDSCVVHCPVNERHIWQKALDLYMHWSNGWRYGDDILRYTIDCELNAGWSTKAKGEFKEHLHDPDWEPTPENLKPVEEYLDAAIATFKEFPELSVYNK